MRTKLALLGALLAGALAFGVAGAGADQVFKVGLYQNQHYACSTGSAIDPSGQSFGVFTVTEVHNWPWVWATVTVDNMKPNLLYRVFVTEYGQKCIQPTLAPGYEVAWFWTNAKGKGSVSFWFWAYTLETSAWVTVQHGNVMTVRSPALPINR